MFPRSDKSIEGDTMEFQDRMSAWIVEEKNSTRGRKLQKQRPRTHESTIGWVSGNFDREPSMSESNSPRFAGRIVRMLQKFK